MNHERARLPLLLLSLLAERPMHGYELNQQITARSIRQWTNIGLSSIYQSLDKLVAGGWVEASEEPNPGQGPSQRKVYTLTESGRQQFKELARTALDSSEHQRFDYDLGLGVALTCLPHGEVASALEERYRALQAQHQHVSAACAWSEHLLSARIVLDHQRRALEMELSWLQDVIALLKT
ncbi:PadR family transcriptional regulator [Ktedonosporobacter rubrisoli]|nr:PadR family transcriptional regulator [Ktedonosporobacter rubrisoli]